jgi:hydrogenase maturation protease
VKRPVRIIGLGNVLMSDDGFGPYVVNVLDAFYDMPAGVQVIDAGTPGLDLTPYLLDAGAVIFVDTVKRNGTAGEIHTYHLSDILKQPPQPRLSPHDPGLKDALLTVAAAGGGPRGALLVGVIPQSIAIGVELSCPVRTAIAAAVNVILSELARLGLPPHPRAIPRLPDIWWDRRPVSWRPPAQPWTNAP